MYCTLLATCARMYHHNLGSIVAIIVDMEFNLYAVVDANCYDLGTLKFFYVAGNSCLNTHFSLGYSVQKYFIKRFVVKC